ncbi:MAG: MBL fold metallo-hydrolase [Actinomycetota bacterium]
MEVIVLGSSGSWPSAGRATSGYLVAHEGFNFWIDLGTGTLARLQEHMAHPDVHAALVTHAHPDHYVDLHVLFYARFFHPEPLPPLPLFMPPGAFDLISCTLPERTVEAMRETFDVREVEPGSSLEAGPLKVETRPMHHNLTTLGLRLQANREVLAYTGDTGPTDEIAVIARDADLLLSEATYLEKDPRAPLHLSARQAGEFAARSGVGRLALTHIWPTVDPEAALSAAREVFEGEVTTAAEGLRLNTRS